MTQSEREMIRRVILEGTEFVLVCHLDPDGDAIGSLLGFGLSLEAAGKKVKFISPDGVPRNYTFLPGAARVKKELETMARGTVAIALDCADLGRTGEVGAMLQDQPHFINVDHHPTNTNFGRWNIVDDSAAATAELAFFLIQELGLPLTLDVGICLYTGIHTDTGGFRYENTTARSHEVAMALLNLGVKPALITDYVYDQKPLTELRLLAGALQRLQVSEDGLLAWISLPRSVLTTCGTDDTSGLINYPRMVAGVEFAFLFKEDEDGTVRVSLRSRQVDVSRLAVQFGGGGHARAAGCTVPGSLTTVEEAVLTVARKMLQEAKGNA